MLFIHILPWLVSCGLLSSAERILTSTVVEEVVFTITIPTIVATTLPMTLRQESTLISRPVPTSISTLLPVLTTTTLSTPLPTSHVHTTIPPGTPSTPEATPAPSSSPVTSHAFRPLASLVCGLAALMGLI